MKTSHESTRATSPENYSKGHEVLSAILPGFYKMDIHDRLAKIKEIFGLTSPDIDVLMNHVGYDAYIADNMVENAVGVFPFPLAFAPNFRINGEDLIAPMVIEEPSVVAAAAHGAKLLRTGLGIKAQVSDPVMIGQIQLFTSQALPFEKMQALLENNKDELINIANRPHTRLKAAGGGAFDLTLRFFEQKNLPLTEYGHMLVVHLHVNVGDAMGANVINSMCERISPYLEKILAAQACLRILTNLSTERTVQVEGRIPFALLSRPGFTPEEVAHGLVKASLFAEVDPYRATTHNKGIMNGVDAFLLATGQDFRAIEASAHAYASLQGHYTSLSQWRIEKQEVVGRLKMPMAVGVVGGITEVHPTVKLLLKMLKVKHAAQLAQMAAAVGLAQNLTAILALSTVGIQSGHMSLHARNIVAALGATPDEVEPVVQLMVAEGQINNSRAQYHLSNLRLHTNSTTVN